MNISRADLGGQTLTTAAEEGRIKNVPSPSHALRNDSQRDEMPMPWVLPALSLEMPWSDQFPRSLVQDSPEHLQ